MNYCGAFIYVPLTIVIPILLKEYNHYYGVREIKDKLEVRKGGRYVIDASFLIVGIAVFAYALKGAIDNTK